LLRSSVYNLSIGWVRDHVLHPYKTIMKIMQMSHERNLQGAIPVLVCREREKKLKTVMSG
jgi:hypothetical protein